MPFVTSGDNTSARKNRRFRKRIAKTRENTKPSPNLPANFCEHVSSLPAPRHGAAIFAARKTLRLLQCGLETIARVEGRCALAVLLPDRLAGRLRPEGRYVSSAVPPWVGGCARPSSFSWEKGGENSPNTEELEVVDQKLRAAASACISVDQRSLSFLWRRLQTASDPTSFFPRRRPEGGQFLRCVLVHSVSGYVWERMAVGRRGQKGKETQAPPRPGKSASC